MIRFSISGISKKILSLNTSLSLLNFRYLLLQEILQSLSAIRKLFLFIALIDILSKSGFSSSKLKCVIFHHQYSSIE
ncbi:TPA: hypothetical protein DEG21_05640 [Patescibacteria group bacterium]|nr:hypothetical protein [Candidatus Gracilibacteria bacterium]HBY75303.1 hypothetical protein [Candidatus Gracilibacteria bacterium]